MLAMTEAAFITYVGDRQECGIYNIQGTFSTNHLVCRPGLACISTLHFDGTESSQCQRLHKSLGESCRRDYYECVNTFTCRKNEYEQNTCDGVSTWRGNTYLKSTFTKPHIDPNYAFAILGIFIVVLWIISLVGLEIYKLWRRQDVRVKQSEVLY